MKIDYCARVEIGKKETNDDRILIDNHILNMTSICGELTLPSIVAVCDGCGGYDGGGIAAQIVLETLSYENPKTLEDANYLEQVLNSCIQAVFEKKKKCRCIQKCVRQLQAAFSQTILQ